MFREDLKLSKHAVSRMFARRLSMEALQSVLMYGREVHVRGATIHAIGRKEISDWLLRGVKLESYEGIQVVCAGGEVLTIYRNRSLQGLRRCRRGRNYCKSRYGRPISPIFGSQRGHNGLNRLVVNPFECASPEQEREAVILCNED